MLLGRNGTSRTHNFCTFLCCTHFWCQSVNKISRHCPGIFGDFTYVVSSSLQEDGTKKHKQLFTGRPEINTFYILKKISM